MTAEILAIIPAYGGARDIPRKHLLPLAGKPLLAHTIAAAQAAHCITRVAVSTDDAEIAAVALQCRAEAIAFPAALGGEHAAPDAALLHALEHLRSAENYRPEVVVLLQCASPLTSAEDIEGTVQALLAQQADCALSVTPFRSALWRGEASGATRIDHDQAGRALIPQHEPQYRETGAVCTLRAAAFLEARRRFSGKTVLYEVPPERNLEINALGDFEIAEFLLGKINLRIAVAEIAAAARRVRLFISDVDGVMTDSGMYYAADGVESKKFNTRDGHAFRLLSAAGIKTAIVTGEQTEIVAWRGRKLDAHFVRMGVQDKVACAGEIIAECGLSWDEVAFIGDDINDTALLKQVGLPGCPADAHRDNRAICKHVCKSNGGHGCVREFADLILEFMAERTH